MRNPMGDDNVLNKCAMGDNRVPLLQLFCVLDDELLCTI